MLSTSGLRFMKILAEPHLRFRTVAAFVLLTGCNDEIMTALGILHCTLLLYFFFIFYFYFLTSPDGITLQN